MTPTLEKEKFLPFLGLWREDTPEIKKLNVLKDINTGKGDRPCSMCMIPGVLFQDEKIHPARNVEDVVEILQTQDEQQMKESSYIPNIKVEPKL